MKLPTVSVVMSTYNHADFVATAMNSVLSQREVDLEFLIADDGSMDGTAEIVASIPDKRIQFFPNEVNRGACAVTNELIHRAKGEFIAVINSDDCWSSNDKLVQQIQVMRNNPTIGACFGRAQFIDNEGCDIAKSSLPFGTIFDQENRTQGAWLRQFFFNGNCICHPTMLIRRYCYENVGLYDNRLRQLPDMDMWIRLVKRYPIYVSERDLIKFRIRPGENTSTQATATNWVRTINEHYLIAHAFFDEVDSNLLINGFGDVLKRKILPSKEHLDIEKVFLYFHDISNGLERPYQMIGLLKLGELLRSNAHRDVLVKDYGVDDRWFQKTMGDIDVLRPKSTFAIALQKSRLRHAWQRCCAWFYRR